MWRTRWDDEGALREKVAEVNRQAEEDRARLRPDRGVEMGKALLHLPEKERGDRHPAEGRVCALVLQRRLAQGPEAHPPKDRRACAGGPLDQIHLSRRNFGTAADSEELHLRSHPGRGVGKEGSPEEGFGVCGSRGVASQVECGSRAEGGVRSPNAGTEEVVHLSCLGGEAGEDAGSAGGEVCANDLKRPGVQRAHRLSPLPRGICAKPNRWPDPPSERPG